VRVVLDTNVLMSGIFFGGTPGEILEAWKEGQVFLVLSPTILDEYRSTGEELEAKHGDFGLSSILTLLASSAEIVDATDLGEPVARDPDDDKFLACARAANVSIVVSGDLDLLSLDPWNGIRILSPREFVDEYLSPT
jgi:putative PIN family toxin of toxin-antitoxin system